MNPIPKPIKWRSSKYRKWVVDGKACVFCQRRASDFMHTGILGDKGTATKSSDVSGIPACEICHRIGEHQYGIEALLKQCPHVNLERICLQQLNDWLANEKKI